MKPPLSEIGDAEAPTPHVPDEVVAGDVYVVPYNNLPYLEAIFEKNHKNIAAFVLEPVVENLSIVLPDEGYLERVRELCDQFDICLIFDEVKTGLTAGAHGAAGKLGVKPDLITMAKSIGGGLPVAAFGGKQKYMDAVVDGRMAHYGTYNGNPLVMAALDAVDEIATEEDAANIAKAKQGFGKGRGFSLFWRRKVACARAHYGAARQEFQCRRIGRGFGFDQHGPYLGPAGRRIKRPCG